MRIFLFCIFLGCLGISVTPDAAEYFVKEGGSDGSTGTSVETPFATVKKAVSVVKHGDIITLLPGTYRESVSLENARGTKDKPIVLRGEGEVSLNGECQIKAGQFVPAEELGKGIYKYFPADKIGIPGYIYRRDTGKIVPFLSGSTGQSLEERLVATPGSWFFKKGEQDSPCILYINPPADADFNSLVFDIGTRCLIDGGKSSYWHISGINFSGTQTAVILGNNSILENCRFHNCRKGWEHPFFSPVLVAYEDAAVRGSEFSKNSEAQARILMSDRVTVEDCNFHDNNNYYEIQFAGNGTGSIIKNCKFVNTSGIGMYPGDGGKNSRNILIQSCHFEKGKTIEMMAGKYLLFDNVFKNTYVRINESFGPVDATIGHNLFISCRPAFSIYGNPVLVSDDNIFSSDTLVSTWQSPEMTGGSWMETSLEKAGTLEIWQMTTGQDTNSIIGDTLSSTVPSTAFVSKIAIAPHLTREELSLNFSGSLRSRISGPAYLRLAATDSSGKEHFSEAEVQLSSLEDKSFTGSVGIIRSPGEVICSITILDVNRERIGGRFLKISEPSSLSIEWLNPSYRAILFSSQSDKNIRASVKLKTDEEGMEKLKTSAGIRQKGTRLKKESFKADKEISVSLPGGDLTHGNYELVVEVEDSKGKVLDWTEADFQYLLSGKNTVRIDSGGNMLVNEEPFFPIGLHGNTGTVEDLELFSQAGFNVTTGGVFMPDVEKELLFMDRAEALGIKIMFLGTQANQLIGDISGEQKKKIMDYAGRIADGIKDHPALLCYLWGEELVWKRELVTLYRQTKAVDPYHPVAMNGSFQEGSSLYYIADVMMNHLYPYPLYVDDRAAAAKKIGRTADECVSMIKIANGKIEPGFPGPHLATGKKPWWLWPQYFYGGGWARITGGLGRFLTLPEMRAHTWSAIAKGTKGIMFWAYFHDYTNPRMNPKLWEGVRAVAGELRSLEKVLVQPEVEDAVTVDDPVDLHMTVREYQDDIYIITCYTGQTDKSLAFTLPADKNISSIKVWSERRTIRVKDNRFEDKFQPGDVHIYTTGTPADTMMEKLLADSFFTEDVNYKSSPENLASVKAGAKVSTSRQYTWYAHQNHAIDGDPDTCWFPLYDGNLAPSFKNPTGENPEWIEVTFEKREKINRIIVRSYTPKHYPDPDCTLSDFDLEWIGTDGGWKSIRSVRGNTKDTVICDFPPVAAEKIRLVVKRGFYLSELEAYGE